MTEEEKKPEDQVSDEELEDVSGGGIVMEDKRMTDISRTAKAAEALDEKLTEPLDKNALEG